MNVKQRILILLEKYDNYNQEIAYKQKFIDDFLATTIA